jgi:murein DD-endopeptidase MepM/ murein hydrolase activator NlpD
MRTKKDARFAADSYGILSLLCELAALLTIALIGPRASYSRALPHETTDGFSHGEPRRIANDQRNFQTPINCADANPKELRPRIPASADGALLHSPGTFALNNALFGVGSDSNIAKPCKQMPDFVAVLNSLRTPPSEWPVVGRVTARFGKRRDPFSGETSFHDGLDIASQYGDAIRAPADGVITKVNRGGSYGLLVVIDHGFGVASRYGHLSRFSARVGEYIRRGEIIGYEGHSGRATGTHLHYELRIDNKPVNPLAFLSSSQLTIAGD